MKLLSLIESRGLQLNDNELMAALGSIWNVIEDNYQIKTNIKKRKLYFRISGNNKVKTILNITNPIDGKINKIICFITYMPSYKGDLDISANYNYPEKYGNKTNPRYININIPKVLTYPYSNGSIKKYLFRELKKSLIHELTHYFDKSITSQRNLEKKDKSLSRPFNWKEYVNRHDENLAYLNEFISDLKYLFGLYENASQRVRLQTKPEDILMQSEVWKFHKDNLSPKNKKKWLRTFAAMWQRFKQQSKFQIYHGELP